MLSGVEMWKRTASKSTNWISDRDALMTVSTTSPNKSPGILDILLETIGQDIVDDDIVGLGWSARECST